jgi:poly(3-hydroxyalkanoate) depolymerase
MDRADEFVRVGGLALRVARRGEGRPLLLIGGIGANVEMWGPLQAHLGDLSTVAFDAPGTGRSDTARLPMRMPALAKLVQRLVARLGYHEIDVLGYSWGGALAQQLAHDAPGLVDRLILAGTTAGAVSRPGSARALACMLTPLRYYSAAHLRQVAPVIAGGRTAREPDLLQTHASHRLAAPPTLWGYQSQLWAMTGWTSAFWLHRLRLPTLVLSGDEDPLIPLDNARFLAWRIPNARLEVIRGGGHLFLIDQPRDAADEITRFLADPT